MGEQEATPRKKRTTVGGTLSRIPSTWKLIAAVIGLVGLGATGFAYAGKFVTRDEVSNLRREVVDLRHEWEAASASRAVEIAVVRADLAAVRQELAEVGDDVRVLLGHILENPPRRRRR